MDIAIGICVYLNGLVCSLRSQGMGIGFCDNLHAAPPMHGPPGECFGWRRRIIARGDYPAWKIADPPVGPEVHHKRAVGGSRSTSRSRSGLLIRRQVQVRVMWIILDVMISAVSGTGTCHCEST